ncbi:MAG: helix-turn-helix domain-containing protein [Alphaproteobacteria bacterium]|nr:helix-turn-helix domain-containing protein [Alphaproteobacteria bacterium]
MARPLRIEFAGALYHLTARFRWRTHAYCLMDNHYHLLVETPAPNLSRGMRQLNGVYTQRFNRRHGRVGHLFQGRFTAILVERDAYLLALVRYVVLNPVRAGMVRRAQDWRWSSYRASAGLAAAPAWLETGWLLRQFARTKAAARTRYRRFVAEGRNAPPVWEGLRDQIYLGGEAFADALKARAAGEEMAEIPRAQRTAPPPLAAFAAESGSRQEAMARAYLSGGYTMKAIAAHFGVHYATVSRAVRAYEATAI